MSDFSFDPELEFDPDDSFEGLAINFAYSVACWAAKRGHSDLASGTIRRFEALLIPAGRSQASGSPLLPWPGLQ